MRNLFVLMFVFLLSGCLAITPVGDAEPAPVRVITPDTGSVLLEVIHAIGPNGPAIERWNSVKLVSVEVSPEAESKAYELERVLDLGPDSAVFAGTLPAGLYRLATFEGRGTRAYRYVATIPQEAGEFFVAGGRLNMLDLMIQSSVGRWNWVYRRTPQFDLRERARELRPDLAAMLDAPRSEPEIRNRESDPDFRIRRAYPTTPLRQSGDTLLLGAQFGRIYVRSAHNDADAVVVNWDAIELDTLQTIIEVLPLGIGNALALTADGRVFQVDLTDGKTESVQVPTAGRVISLGQVDGRVHTVTIKIEKQEGEDFRYRLLVHERMDTGWQQRAAMNVGTQSVDIEYTESEILVLPSEGSWLRRPVDMMRIHLPEGTVKRTTVPVNSLRIIGKGILAGFQEKGSRRSNLLLSEDGGYTWGVVEGVKSAGWPVLDEHGELLLLGNTRRDPQGTLPRVLRRQNDRGDNWSTQTHFPVMCRIFMETVFIEGRLTTLCGERVFQLKSVDYGWQKEALHEMQSALR